MTELKPKLPPTTLLFILLIISLLVGGLGIIENRTTPQSDHKPSPLEILFSLPLLSVGIALFSIYKLTQWSLHPRIFISSEKLRLGDTEKFKWALTKGAGLIKRMQIHLVGREIATEGTGSSKSTHKNTFTEIVLVDQDRPTKTSGGDCEIRVPSTLPSFQGRHNRVQWTLDAFVYPRWRPFKFKYTFNIQCLPPASGETFDLVKVHIGSAIQIDDGRINFAPGEWITGLVSMGQDQEAELQLLWSTVGKGNKDRVVVQRQPVTGGTTTFQFQIPANASPSFSGKLISLIWALQLIVKRGGLRWRAEELDRVRLIVSPTGEEFRLP